MVCEEICALGGVLGYVALIWWNNELSGNWYCLYSECTSCCNCVCIIVQLYPLGVMSNIGGDIWLLDTAVIFGIATATSDPGAAVAVSPKGSCVGLIFCNTVES